MIGTVKYEEILIYIFSLVKFDRLGVKTWFCIKYIVIIPNETIFVHKVIVFTICFHICLRICTFQLLWNLNDGFIVHFHKSMCEWGYGPIFVVKADRRLKNSLNCASTWLLMLFTSATKFFLYNKIVFWFSKTSKTVAHLITI